MRGFRETQTDPLREADKGPQGANTCLAPLYSSLFLSISRNQKPPRASRSPIPRKYPYGFPETRNPKPETLPTMPILVPLLAALVAGLWRFAPVPAALAGSALTLIVAIIVGWRWPQAARAGLPALAMLAALIAALRLVPVPALWPCEVACAGGGHYQTLGGISVLWGSLVGLGAFATLVLRQRERDPLPAPTRALGWALIGASLYFLYLGWRLDVVCPHCLAVHTAVLALAGGLLRCAGAWREAASPALAALLVAGLGLHAAFHPGVVRDTTDVDLLTDLAAPALSAGNKLAYASADSARRRGASAAPVVLELVVDFQCPHCAAHHHDLLNALTPALEAGTAELVIRHLVRRSEPASLPLARWAMGAALEGQARYDLFVATMLGSKPGADPRQLRDRLAETIDPLHLEGLIDRHPGAIDRLVADDGKRLGALKATARTPQLIAVDRATGSVLKRWQGDLPLAEIAGWLAK